MTMFSSQWFASPGAVPGYEVDYSCRFNDGDSAWLTRTLAGAGDSQKTATFFGAFKLGSLAASRRIVFQFDDGAGDDDSFLEITAAHKIRLFLRDTSATGTLDWLSTQVLRDPHAWYLWAWIVDTTPGTPINKFWLNTFDDGNEVTAWTKTVDTLAQNDTFSFGASGARQSIGSFSGSASNVFDGYMALMGYQDGVAAADPVAGNIYEIDDNGVPRFKDVTALSYGTEGALLDFADDSDLGNDVSGNNNDFTSSGLAANDQVTDTPTNNFPTWDPLYPGGANAVLSNGNLKLTAGSGNRPQNTSVVFPATGEYWVEFTVTVTPSAAGVFLGLIDADGNFINYQGDGDKDINGSVTSTWGATFGQGDRIGFHVDLDDDVITPYKNGSTQGSIATTPFASTLTGGMVRMYMHGNSVADAISINYGQLGFEDTPPDSSVALCTTNMPVPTIADPSEHHQVALVDHDGSSTDVTCNWDMDANDTMVIIKNRDNAEKWYVIDGVTGYNKYSSYNTAAATGQEDANVFAVDETTGTLGSTLLEDNYIVEFFKAGLSASRDTTNSEGSLTGTSNSLIISANTTGGFSIVTWVGTAANATFGHGLGAEYEYGQFKNLTDATNTKVYHVSAGLTKSSYTNGLVGFATSSTDFNDGIGFDSDVGSVGTSADTNGSGDAQVAYLWTPISGYSHMGQYTGNGVSNGPLILAEIKPATSMQHGIDSSSPPWHQRYMEADKYNQATKELLLNTTGAENSSFPVDVISNGIKLRTAEGQMNEEDGNFAYVVWGTPFGGHGGTFGGGVAPATAR